MTRRELWTLCVILGSLSLLGILGNSYAFSGASGSAPIDFASEMSRRTGGTLSIEAISFVIGWLAGGIVWALTAIAKAMGKTCGITTVMVSAAISSLGVGVGGYYWGLYGEGTQGIMNAVFATVTAMIAAQGKYTANRQANAKEIKSLLPKRRKRRSTPRAPKPTVEK